jgi:hypothetical protein
MTATALARKGPKYDVPPASVTDAAYSVNNPGANYRIREATACQDHPRVRSGGGGRLPVHCADRAAL